jgi:MFS transporter, ACS family, D-galactonate transporter
MARPPAGAEQRTQASWLIIGLLVASIFINYVDRSNLSVSATDLSRELGLNPAQLGLLLSAFFWTYALFQPVAGWLVDRFNVYKAFGAAFVMWTLATALTGWASTFAMLFALRLLLGIGESIAYPAYSRILAGDFPERHRGIANALIDGGSRLGPAIGTLAGGLIVARLGWRSLFIILGFGGMVWLIPWIMVIPRNVKRPAAKGSPESAPSMLEIVSKRQVWGTCLGHFAGNYAWYFVLTWMPGYLEMERHFTKSMMAVYGSIPYFATASASVATGWVCDRLLDRGANPLYLRRNVAALGIIGSSLMLPASMIANQTVSLALMTLACLSIGMWGANNWATVQTLAGPTAAGKWTGIQNGFANFAGILGPAFTGWVVQETGQFFYAFVVVAAIMVIGAVGYLFVMRDLTPVRWHGHSTAAAAQ